MRGSDIFLVMVTLSIFTFLIVYNQMSVSFKNLKEQFIKNKIKNLYDDLVIEIADEYNIKPKKVKDLDEKERQKIISDIKEEFNKKH